MFGKLLCFLGFHKYETDPNAKNKFHYRIYGVGNVKCIRCRKLFFWGW